MNFKLAKTSELQAYKYDSGEINGCSAVTHAHKQKTKTKEPELNSKQNIHTHTHDGLVPVMVKNKKILEKILKGI